MHELEQILSGACAGPAETRGRGNCPKPQILWTITSKPFFIKDVLIYRLLPTLLQIFRPSAVSVVQQVS